jgi:tRNA(Ile)-lysidine synthetase-like protein
VPGPEGSLSLCAEALRRWPETVLWEVLALAIRSLAPASPFPGAPPRSACRALVAWSRADAPSEALFEFGRRGAEALYRLELRYGAIRITRAAAAAGPPLEELRLQAPGRASWCDWRLEIDEAPRSSLALGFLRGEDPLLEVVDASSVAKAGPLRVRSRHRGERFWPLGSPGEKPLGEFFRERRVWPSERDRVPIVAAGPSIVWVVGHRIDERFRVSDSTERVLVLRASRQP